MRICSCYTFHTDFNLIEYNLHMYAKKVIVAVAISFTPRVKNIGICCYFWGKGKNTNIGILIFRKCSESGQRFNSTSKSTRTFISIFTNARKTFHGLITTLVKMRPQKYHTTCWKPQKRKLFSRITLTLCSRSNGDSSECFITLNSKLEILFFFTFNHSKVKERNF